MKKFEVLYKIQKTGVVALIPGENAEQGIKMAEACLAGGINVFKLSFSNPEVMEVYNTLGKRYGADVVIGIEAFSDFKTAQFALLNGVDYIESLQFDLQIAKLCNRFQITYMAGCEDGLEMITAMEAGMDVAKLSQKSKLGQKFIKAENGPLPFISVMPKGGVALNEVAQWIKGGGLAIEAGSELTDPGRLNDYVEITKRAKQFVQKVADVRKTI